SIARRHKVEAAGHDANHFVGVVIQRDLAADHIGRPVETPLPQATLLVSSSSLNARPSIGWTPKTLHRFHVAFRAGSCSGSPVSVSVACPGCVSARSVKTVLSLRHWIHSNGVEAILGSPVRLMLKSSQSVTKRSAPA